MDKSFAWSVPEWVPEGAQRYLAHTEAGRSIRDLARDAGCHASTVLRQIRRMESRRDDPLVDAALASLASVFCPPVKPASQSFEAEITQDAKAFESEAIRVLRRMCESGAVLAVAEDMDKAVVVRDDAAGRNTRTAIVQCSVAQALALKEWISCNKPGRISRYHITAAGRNALSRLLAEIENRARCETEMGMSEAQTPFMAQHVSIEDVADETGRPRRARYGIAESPLVALARRKDRDGKPFLDEALVRAGERLREDFELSQMEPNLTQNWERFLTGGIHVGDTQDGQFGSGSSLARDRVSRALADLGPGLSDVALRCCCYLEGLETAEKHMGWSARSGKIVLRIALQRLNRHYEELSAADQMIG